MVKQTLALLFLMLGIMSEGQADQSKTDLFYQDYETIRENHPDFESRVFDINEIPATVKAMRLDIIKNPPIKADNKVYFVGGKLVKVDGESYMVQLQENHSNYYFVFLEKLETERSKKTINQLRFGENVGIIGKLVHVLQTTNKMGAPVAVPVFEAFHVEQCNPREYHGSYWCPVY